MSDYSLVPVDYPPGFEDLSLVPVHYDPFSDDGVTQLAQVQQAQTQPAQPLDQPQQSAAGVTRLYVGRPANNTQASEPKPSVGSTPQPPVPTSNVVTPQQMLQGAINQFYPSAQFSGLARQAYQNGQYGNAIGYGVGAVADSLLALTGGKLALAGGKLALAGGKLLGAGVVAGANALRRPSSALERALWAAGHLRQEGDHAHHLVAKHALLADPARVKLQSLGIGIHDAANGVFLPAAQHNSLHSNQYYEAINKALAGATSKAEAERILQSIAQQLKSGTFP